jgi:hypothetical protein
LDKFKSKIKSVDHKINVSLLVSFHREHTVTWPWTYRHITVNVPSRHRERTVTSPWTYRHITVNVPSHHRECTVTFVSRPCHHINFYLPFHDRVTTVKRPLMDRHTLYGRVTTVIRPLYDRVTLNGSHCSKLPNLNVK